MTMTNKENKESRKPYYKNSDKITFDQADDFVCRYVENHGDRKRYVKTKHVIDAFDIEQSRHNSIRISKALQRLLNVAEASGTTTTIYDIKSVRNDSSESGSPGDFNSKTGSEANWKRHRERVLRQYGYEKEIKGV